MRTKKGERHLPLTAFEFPDEIAEPISDLSDATLADVDEQVRQDLMGSDVKRGHQTFYAARSLA